MMEPGDIFLATVHFPTGVQCTITERLECNCDDRHENRMAAIGFMDAEGTEVHFAVSRVQLLGLMEQMADIAEELYS